MKQVENLILPLYIPETDEDQIPSGSSTKGICIPQRGPTPKQSTAGLGQWTQHGEDSGAKLRPRQYRFQLLGKTEARP